MIESIADTASIDDPGPDINDVDLADWIEQHQTVPLPDDDYPYHVPHQYRPAKASPPTKPSICWSPRRKMPT
jgi:hypothetical protein